ncbi:HtaA domain-containing protein, partial [Microbacterium sp. NPDC055442]
PDFGGAVNAGNGGFVIAADGSFEIELTVAEADDLVSGNYGIYTYSGSGAKHAPFETYTPIAFATPSGPSVDVSVTAASQTKGATVRVQASKLGSVSGVYAAIIEKGTEAQLDAEGGYVAFALPFPTVTDGETSFTLVAPTAKLDRSQRYEVILWKQHAAPDADTIFARADVPITDAQWTALFPGTTPPAPVDPAEPVVPVAPGIPVASGSLSWALSSSFTNYITTLAKGSIAVSGGATRANGLFQFGQAAGATFDAAAGTGSVSYLGAVRFMAHAGVLDVTVANPQIRATSPTSAALYVASAGSQVHFANINLGAAAKTTSNGAVTFTGAPVSLTNAGLNRVLNGYSTSLDPITFTVGAAGFAPGGSSGTVAAAPAGARTELPATPPATEGIQLDDATRAALEAGESVEISASGFQPNERGIRVVVYSTPVLLGEVTADAAGTATWRGSLPATLADGEHTLTFQGSVDRGVRFTLAREAEALAGCVVTGASVNWGFREGFRTYIEGIGKGGWDVTGVEYVYPEFVWSEGTGTVDLEAGTGLVAFEGSVRFYGHDGVLDTTLDNARIELAGDVGYLVFDVLGTTQAGDAVADEGVRFVEFALPDLEIVSGALVLEDLASTLTDAGSVAFGTYPAGEQMDPVSAVIPVAADCGEPAVAVTEDAPVAAAAQPEAAEPEEAASVWPWAIGGIALVVVIGAVVWIFAARRRAA